MESPVARAELKKLAVAAPAAAEDLNASALELQAQQARHAGNYLVAATLYRKAAALRHSANEAEKDSGTAAWDLVHAVECLGAAGLFEVVH